MTDTLTQHVSHYAHELSNSNQTVSLNLHLLKDVLQGILPVLDQHAEAHPNYRVAGLPYREFRKELPNILSDTLESSTRIAQLITELQGHLRSENQS